MHVSPAATLVAALALASAHSATAQVASASAQPSSAPASSASQATAGSAAKANGTASSSSAPASTAASTSNPMIPSTVSNKCQSFLTYLNSHGDVAQCTTPLLSALSLFQASAVKSDYTADAAAVQDALSGLCYSHACDDALVRSLLSQFNGNCSQELTAANQVVLGSYDALYVLTPLRDAVCATDANADFCINDIAQGRMPAGSTGANATAVVSSIASSYAAAATASVVAGAPSSNATAATVNNATAAASPAQSARILAAQQQAYAISVPAPPSLYIQVSGAVKRFVRRQLGAASSAAAASAKAPSSATASAASASNSTASASASNATTSAAATAAAVAGASDSAAPAGVHSFSVPSILPNAATWSTTSLPFLFLSPNMSSAVLCSQCTKSILSAYVAWESRMPYALGLANSPLLKGQADLWTATGNKCGGGFLESVAKQAGESNLTGGAASTFSLARSATAGALLLAVIALAA